MATPSIAVLTVTLDDVVLDDIRLDRLHMVIQAAMGWTNSHLFEFQIGGAGSGIPDTDDLHDGPMDAGKARFNTELARSGRKSFNYIYDYGDNWSHTVKVEKIATMSEGQSTFILLEAGGRCPPEDCGGAPGYGRLLETLADPDDGKHEDKIAWCGGPFDPTRVDLPALQANLDRLARRWLPCVRARGKRRS
jgi:hypothetical protein